MLRKSHEMESEIRERMRGGTGQVKITHIFSKNEFKGKIRLMAKITLDKGCSIGFHRHENEEEIFYILKGTGQIDDNGSIVTVNPGDAILTGDGKGHGVENTGTKSLELLAIILLYN